MDLTQPRSKQWNELRPRYPSLASRVMRPLSCFFDKTNYSQCVAEGESCSMHQNSSYALMNIEVSRRSYQARETMFQGNWPRGEKFIYGTRPFGSAVARKIAPCCTLGTVIHRVPAICCAIGVYFYRKPITNSGDLQDMALKAHTFRKEYDPNPLHPFIKGMLLRAEGPSSYILGFLGRRLTSLLYSGLGDYDCPIHSLIDNVCMVTDSSRHELKYFRNERVPCILYKNPTIRVANVSYELNNLIENKVAAQRAILFIDRYVDDMVNDSLYKLRNTQKHEVNTGDGHPGHRESSSCGAWGGNCTVQDTWLAQLKHMQVHRKLLKSWDTVICYCDNDIDRLIVIERLLNKDGMMDILPHHISRVAQDALLNVAASAIEPIFYSWSKQKPNLKYNIRSSGAEALQRRRKSPFPRVFYESEPCQHCTMTTGDWQEICKWRDDNCILWADLGVGNYNPAREYTLEEKVNLLSSFDEARQAATEVEEEVPEETKLEWDDDPSFQNHGYDAEQDAEDQRQAYLERDENYLDDTEDDQKGNGNDETTLMDGSSSSQAIPILSDTDTDDAIEKVSTLINEYEADEDTVVQLGTTVISESYYP